MSHVLTPGTLLVLLLGLLLAFAPMGVVFFEERHKRTTRGSKVCAWLFLHEFEVILLAVSSVFAVWRLEHGSSLAAAAEYFLVPAAWIGGGLFRQGAGKLRGRRDRAEG